MGNQSNQDHKTFSDFIRWNYDFALPLCFKEIDHFTVGEVDTTILRTSYVRACMRMLKVEFLVGFRVEDARAEGCAS